MHAHLPPKSAISTLVEVFTYYKHEASVLESLMWKRLVEEFGDEAVIRFLEAHVMRSTFSPRVSEALAALRPGANNAAAAFLALAEAVARCGPYAEPRFDDPAMAGAIVRLGGWTEVNRLLPDPGQRFDHEAFAKRFETAYALACADVTQGRAESTRLRGLHALSLSPAAPAALPLAPAAQAQLFPRP